MVWVFFVFQYKIDFIVFLNDDSHLAMSMSIVSPCAVLLCV